MAPLARADRVAITLRLLQLPPLAKPLDDQCSRFLLCEPHELASLFVHAAVRRQHHRFRQPVRTANLEVDGVVARRHLERAGTELGIDSLVRDDGNAPLEEGHDDLAPDEFGVPLVPRVHGNRDIGKDRRRANRGDRNVP
jgi:hypothetical protein